MSSAPIAYFDSTGRAIFRASAANKCTKALVASLLSYSPVPPPADMQRRFDLGHKHEPTILAHVASLPGWSLYGAQEEFSFAIGDQIQVNCHPDSLGTHPEHGMAIIESKALAPSGYNNWVKHKFSAFEDYAIQQAVQWEAIPGVQMVVMAVGRKSEGIKGPNGEWIEEPGERIEEIDVSYFLEPPYSINKVKAHLIKAAKLGRDGVLPESCDRSNYPCPFVYLETKDAEEPVFQSENAVEIAAAASDYNSARAIEKAASQDKADARAVLLDLLGDNDRAEAGGFRVRRDKKTTVSRDWKGIKAAGIDLSPFESPTYTDQLTVEEVG